MVLTRQQKTLRNPDKFPTAQLFILALCRVSEPIALTSILPIAYPMTKRLLGDWDASLYSGILISAFALAESLTGLFWGSVSDRVGRKPVLLFGCTGTMLSLVIVGFAPTFWVALLGRALGGFLNGNIGVIQTMVGELVTNPAQEPRAYAVMPFVWSIGTIIGPAIGGTFADPTKSWSSLFSPSGVFAKFPYLLPNLVCALMLLVSIIVGYFLLEETHPDMQPWSTPEDLDNTCAETPLMATAGATEHAGVDLRGDSYGTFNTVDITEEERWKVNSDGTRSSSPDSSHQKPRKSPFTKRVILLVVALAIFTFHSMGYDCLLAIFLQDKRDDINAERIFSPLGVSGGLGLSTRAVGGIMSIQGCIALFIQGVVFPIIATWIGVWKTFILVTTLHPLAYFVVPFLIVLPENDLYTGIYLMLTLRNFLSILAYPTLLILLKEASPSRLDLGKINGLAASAGAACRTVAPPVVGYLYTLGKQKGFSGLAWWGCGVVALVGSIQCWSVTREKGKVAHVRHVHCVRPQREGEQKSEVVHIIVNEVDGVEAV